MNHFLGNDQETNEGDGVWQLTGDQVSGYEETILYAEDEPFVPEVMGAVLRAARYQVLICEECG